MGGMRVIIGCNSMDRASIEVMEELCGLLRGRGIEPCVLGEDNDLAEIIEVSIALSPENCTHIVTIGGDGTILKWGKLAAEYGLPLLGVNMGRLGFMATVEPSEVCRIPDILMGEYPVSRRMLLDCEIVRNGRTLLKKSVLNDAVISRGSNSKLPEFRIFCGEYEVTRVRADGVILSTPTGSTAYSLSAGGPILAPELECIEFTALCPHTLFNRPMIFSAQQLVTARVRSYQDSTVTVSLDGGRGIVFGEEDELRLSRSERTLSIIEAGSGFFGAVHNKLMAPLK
ncbi:MAG: NAD(+)/NADH kinase [Oscillospiraceae bacterium]